MDFVIFITSVTRKLVNAMQHIPFILGHYPSDCQPEKIQFLGGAGGFSGAAFWRITAQRGLLCLRRWPKEHPNQSQIEFIHGLLKHVVGEGFSTVPLPISLQTDSTMTYFKYQGYIWELAPWMSGTADYLQSRSTKKFEAALHSLANFHQAASKFIDRSTVRSRSVTVHERLEQINLWIQSDISRLEACGGKSQCILKERLPQWKNKIIDYSKHHIHRVKQLLSKVVDCRVPIQACLRDIWHDHILFQGDHVSGVIDFGAARPDTVVADLTRLLGSLAANNKAEWECGINAYESISPLSDQERLLIYPLDQSAILLSGLNWMRWLYLENRRFSDEGAVTDRLEHILCRLENADTKID